MSLSMNLPLQDIRILAVEQYGAGPFGSMHLADLGAEVIKIESPPAHIFWARTTASFFKPSTATKKVSCWT
jgi:crotonobetainyl-CoA:carnitine CoA-transferase CaiB-like acyl-CoA transferase